ncbi:MAG: methyltransferase domain-containing protein [Acidimicrobiia bacterium]|nr:methyltransferase domain-containing protein [Acidimicrobiia bacterium]
MRHMTEAVVADATRWTETERRAVASFFDDLAPEWDERHRNPSTGVLADAWLRGDVPSTGRLLEVGSGTGRHSSWLAERADELLCVDVAWQMLTRAPAAPGQRLLADGAHLPLPDASVDTAVLLNAFLFPAELRRVLRPGGVVVWANSRGAGTPIYLPAERVVEAMGDAWAGMASEADGGSWVVARRQLPD